MNVKKYYQIADRELNVLFGNQEASGNQELANKTLKYFYTETVLLKMFLESTGKIHEYGAWVNRFKKSFPDAQKNIESNVVLELE